MSGKRSRSWTFIGYPESLPQDWHRILMEDFIVCGCCSPLHDADLNADETEKKAHRHFLLVFDGMKSYEQIKEITDALHATIPQICRNPRSMVRYFLHLDNPEKHRYSAAEIISFGGCDYEQYLARSQSEIDQIAKDIRDFIRVNHIVEFSDLIDAVDALGDPDWLDVLQNKMTLFFSHYMKSVYFKYLRSQKEREGEKL